ncbi:MAG: DUF1015 domain-containing protein, partial [Candidatus Omnitrophica bacterium]|nr:DUF1015 domain-containing protein [Candidatus Omnitrophota bacterium]
MAEIKPFTGILYNKDKVRAKNVVTPPYDVISSSMQKEFYRRSPYNVIRLILGKKKKSDTRRNNSYTRAKLFLNNWIRGKILLRDRTPSIYIYRQDYSHTGRKRTRIGFIALMKIEKPDKSGILPHEYTLAGPKKDRLMLIKSTKANLSPIFSLFEDTSDEVNGVLKNFTKSNKPVLSLEEGRVTHTLWRMGHMPSIRKIEKLMKKKKVFIADGHHRYEVALIYRDTVRQRRTSLAKNADYVMMYFSNLSDEKNLTILATHRVVKCIEGYRGGMLPVEFRNYFEIRKISRMEKCIELLDSTPRARFAFAFYAGEKKLYLLTLKKKYRPERFVDSQKHIFLKKLDVTILHDFVIRKILCVKNPENNIKYIRNEHDAVSLVDKGDYQAAFFLRPTRVADMKNIAEQGEM